MQKLTDYQHIFSEFLEGYIYDRKPSNLYDPVNYILKLGGKRLRPLLTLMATEAFEGDVHETACRLEHAFNDDLEVCISLLLGNPTLDPSGRNIPPANSRIAHKLEEGTNLSTLAKLGESVSGEVILIMTTSNAREVLRESGLGLGDVIERKNSAYMCNGNPVEISEELAKRIVLRCN